jgi:glucose dehydrogenase
MTTTGASKMNRKKAYCLVLALAWVVLFTGSAWGAIPVKEPLWQTPFDFLSPDQYNSIVIYGMGVSPTLLIVCGSAKNSSTGLEMGFIKAFDVSTGVITWTDTLPAGDFKQNAFTSLAMAGDVVTVRGGRRNYSGSPPPYTEYKDIIRAYNVSNGEILWEASSDWERPPTDYILGPVDILVANNRVFSVLDAVDNSGTRTGVCMVRAYQIKNIVTLNYLLLDK